MPDSIILEGKKYSRKQKMEDLGYEGYNITSSVMGQHTNVRETWYDPKTGAMCGSSTLIINKEAEKS